MKKAINYSTVLVLAAAFFWGCDQKRNFYEDSNDPGLSRLTSRGYNILTLYIDANAYINPYAHHLFGGSNTDVRIEKLSTNSTYDTLVISWQIQDSKSSLSSPYSQLSLLIPVDKSFTKNEFRSWEGKRFPQDSAVDVTIELNGNPSLSGPASVYFIKNGSSVNSSSEIYYFTGLFEGEIGNNIRITKGRFDFYIYGNELNF